MRDDVLGAFGDTATTGKPVGDDLREGKPTPLMAIATEHANASQLEVLQLVGHARLTDTQVTDVQRVIRETGALDQLEAEISNKTDEAIAVIQQAPITDVAREELIALASYVSWRSV
jgi:geranylgeranyl diphosphate synthase type I